MIATLQLINTTPGEGSEVITVSYATLSSDAQYQVHRDTIELVLKDAISRIAEVLGMKSAMLLPVSWQESELG